MQDSYDFTYDCEIGLGEFQDDMHYTTIDISVSVESERPRRYLVEYYVKDTPTMDLQSVGGELLDSVMGRLTADLAADGVKESMLTFE